MPAGRVRVTLRRGLEKALARDDGVTRARIEMAKRISGTAERNTRVGETAKARDSHRVEVERWEDPPRVAACAGDDDEAFHYVFQEFGGYGFRPPPAPLRSAAKRHGRYRDRRR